MVPRGQALTSRGRALTSKGCCAGSADGGGGKEKKKETKLGLAHRKADEFGEWYSEVVVESEMISYYDVSGELCEWAVQTSSLPLSLRPEGRPGLLIWQLFCHGLHIYKCCTSLL